MPAHVFEPAAAQTILTAQAAARLKQSRTVPVDGQPRTVPSPFPSPGDWRDNWIYFLMIDRFNNAAKPATTTPDIEVLHEYF
jgi:hypothetical protein